MRHKENKLPSYRNTISEVWLLLAVEGFQPSTWLDVGGSALEAEYTTGFDRVYVLDYQKREGIRLSTGGT